MASHNRTPKSVLEAPKQTYVEITYRTEGYTADANGTLYRTTPRRGKNVKRHRKES